MKLKSIFSLLILVGLNFTSQANYNGIMFYKAGFPREAKFILLDELNSDAPNKAEISYYLGNIYFQENKVDSASYYFNFGKSVEPTYSQNEIGLIMLRMKNDPKLAEADIKKVIKLPKNKKNINIYLATAYAFLYNDMAQKAMYYHGKANALKPKNAQVSILLGDIEEKKNTNIGEASRNYELAIYYDANCKEAYIKYARIYKNVNPKAAIEQLKVLKDKAPGFYLVNKELGDIYYGINNFEMANLSYQDFLKAGFYDSQDLIKYSMSLFLSGKYEESLKIANLGLQKDNQNAAFNRLRLYNQVSLKQYTEGLISANRLFKESNNVELIFNDYTYYAIALKETKQFGAAIEQYQIALQKDTSKVDIYKDLAELYEEKKEFKNAITSYTRYMNANAKRAKNAEVIFGLGKLYYNLGVDAATSKEVKNQALVSADSLFAIVGSLEPQSFRAELWRGRANSGLDPETTTGLAKPYYEKAAKMLEEKNDPKYNSNLIECYSYLGYYNLQKGDYNASNAYWSKVLKINQDNVTAKKALEGIKKMNKK